MSNSPFTPTRCAGRGRGEDGVAPPRTTGRGEDGGALTPDEKPIFDKALTLKELHDELDAAVAAAYGWPVDLPEDEVLARLVALNRERAAEEAKGFVAAATNGSDFAIRRAA